ncbi:MAG: FG-GAP-like repeat-containing protein [Phycisphaeraceae bacterium]
MSRKRWMRRNLRRLRRGRQRRPAVRERVWRPLEMLEPRVLLSADGLGWHGATGAQPGVVATVAFSASTDDVRHATSASTGSEIERVSVARDGMGANAYSEGPALSADGRYVAFQSMADNLVPGDTNGFRDIFIYDRQTGTPERISVAADGSQANGDSHGDLSFSGDGRFVCFDSSASNLVEGDDSEFIDVFVYDREGGGLELVSVASDGTQGNGHSYAAGLSEDGRYVLFASYANTLVDNDTNASGPHAASARDYFVRDRETGETERVSVASDGSEANANSWSGSISSDGRYVAFHSEADNLVANDRNDADDVFIYDRDTDRITRVSVTPDGMEANANSRSGSLSADGRYLVFDSYASNLVPGDTNNASDVFVYDRETGRTERVSVAADGTEGDRGSWGGSLSADGRFVVFDSPASNLVPGDTNGHWDGDNPGKDIFVRDLATGAIQRVDLSADGEQGNGESWSGAISGDGRYVGFVSLASNLVPGDTNNVKDVFVAANPIAPTRSPLFDGGGVGSVSDEMWQARIAEPADIDGDGDIDVVSATRGALGWHENLGDGTFADVRWIASDGPFTGSLVVADFDGDGDPDIAAGRGQSLVWYANDGGSFGSAETIDTLAGDQAGFQHVSAGDLSGDGRPDLVAARTSDVVWYASTDSGFSSARTVANVSQRGNPVAADVDGDGHLDVVASVGRFLYWYRHDGAGGFGSGRFIASNMPANDLLAADLNHDGRTDLLVTQEDRVTWFANAGSGEFGSRTLDGIGVRVNFHSADVADIDANGTLDVLVTSENHPAEENASIVAWYAGDGRGGFGERQSICNDAMQTARVADIDGDGDLDVVGALHLDGRVAWYESLLADRQPTFIGDVTGDGSENVITFDGFTATWRVASIDGGRRTEETWANWSADGGWRNPIAGDFNGDGLMDVAAQNASNAWWVGVSSRTGFTSSFWGWWNPEFGFQSVHAGDFNGDGRTDLFGQTTSGVRWVSQSVGNRFQTSGWGHWPSRIAWDNLMVGDFNGDGRDDLAGRFVNASGTDVWWVAESDGSRLNNRFYSGWPGDTGEWQDVRFIAADFDGDRIDDIAGRCPASGNWWLGISERRESGPRFAPQGWGQWNASRNWTAALVGDFNGDGRDDLAGLLEERQANVWWLSRSEQRIISPWPGIAGRFDTSFFSGWVSASHSLLAGDFNGDGSDDLLGQDAAGYWWWLQGGEGNSSRRRLS